MYLPSITLTKNGNNYRGSTRKLPPPSHRPRQTSTIKNASRQGNLRHPMQGKPTRRLPPPSHRPRQNRWNPQNLNKTGRRSIVRHEYHQSHVGHTHTSPYRRPKTLQSIADEANIEKEHMGFGTRFQRNNNRMRNRLQGSPARNLTSDPFYTGHKKIIPWYSNFGVRYLKIFK
jgi:hypothetical protein